MNAEQIAKLKDFAQKAIDNGPGNWPFHSAAFKAHITPAAVLELIAKVQTPLHEHNARFAIDGAMWKGHENVDPPPTEDHWLMPYWKMARELAEFKAAAERTTSPVSQMTAHLAAIEEALKVMRDNGLDECYAFENAIEALAFMKEVAK